MSTKSLARISGWLLLGALVFAVPAFAGKDDTYKQAQALAGSNPQESARLYCQLAQEDPGYKDVKMM